MNSAIFVQDWNEQQFPLLSGRAAVISIRSLEDVTRVREAADRHHVSVHCLSLHTKAPLALVPLRADAMSFPLALFTARMGRFQDLVRLLPVLKAINVRIYMPAHDAESLTGMRILASLGIDCAVAFDGSSTRWDLLADLMTYALLGLASHADIEPFAYIEGRYGPQVRGSFSAVYFDDPTTYLHVSPDGRIALTRTDLREGRFFAPSIAEVTEENRLAAWEAHNDSWRGFFLDRSRCAQCPGWRICGGALSAQVETDPGCSAFFAELMDVIDRRRESKKKVKTTWRP